MTWTLKNSSNDPGEIAWLVSPTSGTLEPFGETVVEVVAQTSGLNARLEPYLASFAIHSDDVCVCRDQSAEMSIELLVLADVSAANSFVEVLRPGSVRAGGQLRFLITPIDDEGMLIEDSVDVQFAPVLKHDTETDIPVVCAVVFQPDTSLHEGTCAMPLHDNAPLAGEFRLAVDLITSSINDTAVLVTRELVGGTVHSVDVTSCPQGFFLDDSKTAEGGVRCTPCEPRTMSCPAGSRLATLTLSRGYYRNSPSTTRIRECPQFIGCRGGNVTGEYCATGYESALCATCEPGYFMSSWKTCERCESSEKWAHMALSFTLIASLVAVASIIRRKQFATLWEFIWTSMSSQVKILWSTLQILSQFIVLLSVYMPPVLSEFYGALDISQFNPLSAFALSCASGSLARFLPKLLFMTLAPIALGGAILAHCLFQVHVWKLERGPCQKRSLRLFLLMCYFVLPATSTTIFRTFL